MQMSEDIALWLQDELLGLDHEDYGLVYILSGNLASIPQDSEERWQLGVDVIYRALICGLVKVNDLGATSDQASFLHSIRTLNPYDRSGEGYWHATLIWGAERLTKLIEAYFLPPGARDNKLNPSFIEALERLFAENGVPWSDKPLLPIMPTIASAPAASR